MKMQIGSMNNKERIVRFQKLICDSLVPLINDDYVLLDIPNHCNIGDNLIWEGELQFLKENVHHKCLYSANVFNWEEKDIQTAPIILFHGGGNFGDLYRVCQLHRLYITRKYHCKKIIIFPQTVWYNDISLLKDDSVIFNAHPNIFICTRDQLSYDTLAQYINKEKLLLLPDMAFCIRKLPLSNSSLGKKVLFMLRTDDEIDRNFEIKMEGCDVKDWPTYYNNRYVQLIMNIIRGEKVKLSVLFQKIPLIRKMVDPVYGLNCKNSRRRYIKKGVSFFESYEKIYTTRLHGLILGILMNKEITIIDNKYNKCRYFYQTWLKDFDSIISE